MGWWTCFCNSNRTWATDRGFWTASPTSCRTFPCRQRGYTGYASETTLTSLSSMSGGSSLSSNLVRGVLFLSSNLVRGILFLSSNLLPYVLLTMLLGNQRFLFLRDVF